MKSLKIATIFKMWVLAPLFIITTAIAIVTWIFTLHRITTEPSYVTVIVDKPWIFGHGGVRNEVQKPGVGWFWITTKGIHFPTYDFKKDEKFDDLPTKKKSFIDFSSYLKIRILDPVKMVTDFGYTGDQESWWTWYNNSIAEQYRTIVRNVAKDYIMEDILSDPKVLDEMEKRIREQMDKLIKEIGIPIMIVDLSLGRASPNKSVMEEIDETSRQQQRVNSEAARNDAERKREAAETARAAADNAYRKAMGLSPQEFVALEAVKKYSEACKTQGATCIITTGESPLVMPKK